MSMSIDPTTRMGIAGFLAIEAGQLLSVKIFVALVVPAETTMTTSKSMSRLIRVVALDWFGIPGTENGMVRAVPMMVQRAIVFPCAIRSSRS